MKTKPHTIAAQATPPGHGGVGIVRVSGPLALLIAQKILNKTLKARYATFCDFFSAKQKVIDRGLAIYFPSPHSFTGEDVLELHCHGGVIIIDILLQRILELGAYMARPGEFMERAFLNHKIDLIQAEAVADLIDATTSQAAQNAARSLQGEFSRQINKLLTMLIKVRTYLEAIIDFPEEELSALHFSDDIDNILLKISILKNTAKQGMVLRDGITVVIAGKPNAGKSSLFNYLTGQDAAIVTDIPGTTRDVLHAHIQIDGLPINLLDTAGFRDKPDIIEGEGIRRALGEIKKADLVLLMADKNLDIPKHTNFAVLHNKIDLSDEEAKIIKINNIDHIYLSVKNQKGLDLLKQYIKDSAGLCALENGFSARRRHLDALDKTEKYLNNAKQILLTGALELASDDLRKAQHSLGEITGEFTSDDLLGKIFSEFCIGK